MKKIIFSGLCLLGFSAMAQMTTPGTGVKWNLDSLVAQFPGGISKSGDTYTMSDSLEIAAGDTLFIENYVVWKLDSAVQVDVFGAFIIDADSTVQITAVDTVAPYHGFRMEEFSHVSVVNASIKHGGGIRVLTEDFFMDACFLMYNHSGAASGGAISFSRGEPVVMNSVFKYNELPAFSSGANQEVAAVFKYNHLEHNNLGNSNRPQINMGPTGADTTYIIGNTIIGDTTLNKVGGISVSSLLGIPCNAVIDSNEIRDNRYGITMTGSGCFGYIRYNSIIDNDSETNPLIGGSGISLYGGGSSNAVEVIATGNEISGNLWGITLIDSATINLGDTAQANYNPGGNIFMDNGNGGITYALYNNTPHDIVAMNNCWLNDTNATAADVEGVIFDAQDDSTLGYVYFNPFIRCGDDGPVGIDEAKEQRQLNIYPNPSSGILNVEMQSPGKIILFNISGREVLHRDLQAGSNILSLDIPAGIYIASVKENGKLLFTKKLIVSP